MAILGFKNVIGEFSFTDKYKVSKKKADLVIDESNIDKYSKVLFHFKNKKYFSKFFAENLKLTTLALGAKKDYDFLIREIIKELDPMYRARNTLKDEILLKHLDEVIVEKEIYLESLMEKYCPNLLAVADAFVGGKLIHAAGSLEKLSRMTARKIQIIGAESAFFRFLKSQRRDAPMFGIIFNHSLVKRSLNKGKASRLLSDKIVIAARVDFFKGEFIGDKLREEIEQKID
ncbi:MAG: hypothetical protein WC471_00715 [Candidatus Woesearchaeota archaeon]